MATDFAVTRDRLIAEIAENLAKAVTNVNLLNRNIESVAVVGAGLKPVNKLWKQFEGVMSQGGVPVEKQQESTPTTTNQIRLDPLDPSGTTEQTAVLPAGIAPGGGETAVLAPESKE